MDFLGKTRSHAAGSGRVNLVPLPAVVTSPRDMALAAVICSALATVLLALLVLCIIYCKRQLLEKKPSAASLRSQDCPYGGAELSYLDPRWLQDFPQRPCCRYHLGPGHTCGPVHLIPSLCCDESCAMSHSRNNSPFQSLSSLSDRDASRDEEAALMQRTEPDSMEGGGVAGNANCEAEPGARLTDDGTGDGSLERSRPSCTETAADALSAKQPPLEG